MVGSRRRPAPGGGGAGEEGSGRPLALAVVSYPSVLDGVFEDIALRLSRGVGPGFVVERCQDARELPYLVQRWKRRGFDVTRLDLHGHGAGGEFSLGDALLFASDGTGYGLARQLGPQLAPGARLRLVGCRTGTLALLPRRGASRHSGPRLLADLERVLRRGRTAWGATAFVRPDALGPRGLPDDTPLLRRR